ncbi:ActS/PrrB/RegB family redox-sensitive histidine kinase [Hansschlegelia quercus]|uniref:histidine kinase n=1 Tax=Hansschlegelia quercus TaxID=2528245 RepID=A0A4Q9GDT0_9HYPH|nr:ActS/PrrB/RegB family redox-sensitive histidine kinase [Hansschlegelia quercus]TBN48354.1 ActS/PrrB/RegB family redox-sensitive histidine kinase [Hansschlegelia quercus]
MLAQRHLRLDTLVRLRWLAVAGQSCAVVVVHAALDAPLPIAFCLAVIACSAALNVAARLLYPITYRLNANAAGLLLGYDILQLAALLYLTGGLENPFSILFLAPVMISATALPPLTTAMLGAAVGSFATLLALRHLPLPWPGSQSIDLPFLYVTGVWVALMLALGFIGVYAWRVAEEARELSQALAATELVLAREQHLSALDGLAAAAAHELGTPLATIALVAKELERALTPGPHEEDLKLLREQVARCREILRTLTSLDEGGAPFETLAMRELLEEIAAPHRNFGVALDIRSEGDARNEPVWPRNPSVLYGLGNLVENAVDFAGSKVTLVARWTDDRIDVDIGDDGPGFAADIIGRLGEPYVSTRAAGRDAPSEAGGLGLGFFIAKTLLERSGAQVSLSNAALPDHGARIRIVWPRARLASGPETSLVGLDRAAPSAAT